jgi:hypothetical protein
MGLACASSGTRADVGRPELRIRPEGGLHRGPIAVQLTSPAPGASIYFTTNGTLPSATNGFRYTAPLSVAATTVLRATAIGDDLSTSAVSTRTYLFADGVLRQDGAGCPESWGVTNGQAVRAYYPVQLDAAATPELKRELLDGLGALPTVSLVLSPADLFGPKRGIYANPQESGDDWERPVSMEYFERDHGGDFQIDAGLRIQGGWNRRPEESPKHSFRIVFRKGYGAARLKHRLFDGGAEQFETLIFRGGNNNSWLHWSGQERRRADYVRDQWMRDTYREMGQVSARGVFVHLYLNGLYWGVYNLVERPSAPFAASYLGGAAKDWESRNADKILSGDDRAWKRLFALAHSGLTTDAEWQELGGLLDLPAFIDFLIVNLYGANGDWDAVSNWYAARRRSPAGLWHFFVWDGERTLEEVSDSGFHEDNGESPMHLFNLLRPKAKFRTAFADRVQKHFFGSGPLTAANSGARFQRISRQLETPIIGEAARWGDYRRSVHPYKEGPFERYTRDDHWRPEIARLLRDYFPKRSDVVLGQFREAGLIP